MWKIYLSSSFPHFSLNIGFYICKKCEKEEENLWKIWKISNTNLISQYFMEVKGGMKKFY